MPFLVKDGEPKTFVPPIDVDSWISDGWALAPPETIERVPPSIARFGMPSSGSFYALTFNSATNALLPLVRTSYTGGSGTDAFTNRCFIIGDGIDLLDDSLNPIPEGSSAEGKRIRLAPGHIWEVRYTVGGQDVIGEYADIGVLNATIFEAQIAAQDPSPHRLGLLNYASDATLEPEDRSDNLRPLTGEAILDLRNDTDPLVICIGAYAANDTGSKGVAWWHTSCTVKKLD